MSHQKLKHAAFNLLIKTLQYMEGPHSSFQGGAKLPSHHEAHQMGFRLGVLLGK